MRKTQITIATVTCFLLLSLSAAAQTAGGGLQGRVTDASGASIPNTRVELERVDTGQRYSVTADETGTYRFADLPVGTYRVVTASGAAATAAGQEIRVELGRTGNMTLVMPSGPTTDAMVAAAASPVQDAAANVQNNYNTRMIHYLPQPNLVTRDGAAYGAYNLGLLGEAVVSPIPGQAVRGPAVSGSRPEQNNFSIDGIDNNNKANPGPLVYVSNEATTEFGLFHNQPNPMLPHSSGARFNSIVRSGTNQVHGAIYNYLQNRHLNAIPSALRRAGYTEQPRYDQNRLGASLGLPVVPSKFFLFGNFEYIPRGYTTPAAINSFAPTAAGLASLSQINGLSATNLGILQGLTGSSANASRFVSVGGRLIPAGAVTSEVRGWENQYNGTAAADWTWTDKDQLRFRYVHNESEASNPGFALPAFTTERRMKSLLASAGHYHSFGNTAVNELRFGYNRLASFFDPSGYAYGGFNAFPNIAIGGTSNLLLGPQAGMGDQAAINTYQLADTLAFNIGGHNLRIGADGRRYLGYMGGLPSSLGTYAYSSLERFLRDLPPDVASQRTFGNDRFDLGQWLIHAHVQDTWNVAQGLTVDLGLRWQYATVPNALQIQTRNEGRVDGVFELDEPLAGWRNFAPHLGIAFAPGANRTTVFRAGFGMHYDALYANQWFGMTGFAPSVSRTVYGNLNSTASNFLRNGGLQDPLRPGQDLTDPQQRGLTTSWAGDQRLPYSMQWNAAIEQALGPNTSIAVKYLGNRGVNLPVYERLNANPLGVSASRNLPLFTTRPSQAELNALPVTLAQLQAASATGGSLGEAGFTSPLNTINWGGNSWYQGATLNLNHRFTGGFQVLGNYTWSRFEDDATGTLADIGMPRIRTWSIYDRRHAANATAMFELGTLLRNTPVAAFFADLNVNGTYYFQSEGRLPVTSFADTMLNGNAFGSGAFFNAAGQTGVGSGVSPLVNSQGQTVAYIANNPNAQFIAGAPGTFIGQRNYLRTNENHSFDVAASKRFTWMERWAFELRGEAYNVFNTTQLGGGLNNLGPRNPMALQGVTTPGNPAFGDLESVFGNNARLLQVALRLTF